MLSLLWVVPYIVVATPFTVAWTKLAAGGADAVTSRPAFVFGRAEWLYLFASMLLTIALFGPVLICLFVSFLFGWSISFIILGLILLAVAIPLGLRFSFVLPSVALEDRMGFGASWHRTKGSIWRIVALGALAGLPFSIAQSILRAFVKQMSDTPGLIVAGFAQVVVSVLLAASATGAMTLAYKFRTARAVAVKAG